MHIFADTKVMQYSDGLKDLTWIQQWIQKQQKSYSQQGYGNYGQGYTHLEYLYLIQFDSKTPL